ncbi:hypothetical protein HAX54_021164 [Datura stramonium]|uniref:Uncharacterized protein n=1 Tax=Datura stramonium TaxID=4076 RepID=A0ABS8UUL7_DATST|nr:hypothetical protein [Datura stramonium]
MQNCVPSGMSPIQIDHLEELDPKRQLTGRITDQDGSISQHVKCYHELHSDQLIVFSNISLIPIPDPPRHESSHDVMSHHVVLIRGLKLPLSARVMSMIFDNSLRVAM